MSVLSTVYQFSYGLASAVSVRVSNTLGAGDGQGAVTAAVAADLFVVRTANQWLKVFGQLWSLVNERVFVLPCLLSPPASPLPTPSSPSSLYETRAHSVCEVLTPFWPTGQGIFLSLSFLYQDSPHVSCQP